MENLKKGAAAKMSTGAAAVWAHANKASVIIMRIIGRIACRLQAAENNAVAALTGRSRERRPPKRATPPEALFCQHLFERNYFSNR